MGIQEKQLKNGFYFSGYENKTPPEPSPYSSFREFFWQFTIIVSLALGARYIVWRWGFSLNTDALWFSIPLVLAETYAYAGLVLFATNLWAVRDTPIAFPPKMFSECVFDPENFPEKEISVDIFFPTYDEDPELVRLSVIDAKKIRYPHPLQLRIHVLDDGKRDPMKQVAEEEGVNYIIRPTNKGFKAGNLRNAMEQTDGDFILICDADTRPFPTILENTLGYFKDPAVAWVQTPQWFYDIPEGIALKDFLKKRLGRSGFWFGAFVEKIVGPWQVGRDPFCNDPKMFYDVIQRRRNWANASFCCGAGSIQRREAVMQVAMSVYARAVNRQVETIVEDIRDKEIRFDFSEALRNQLRLHYDDSPFQPHVSEDFLTSLVIHSETSRNWKSVYHPRVESKMLSPQDLLTWSIQRFKYAAGTLDIYRFEYPKYKKGLSFWQRRMYESTFWSYLGSIWNIVFLAAPIIYLFTAVKPIKAYSLEFFLYFLPFIIINEIAFLFGTWGEPTWNGKASYMAFFPINFKALVSGLRKAKKTEYKMEKIKFKTTPKTRQSGNFFRLVIPQFTVIVLTAVGIVFGGIRLAIRNTDTFPVFFDMFFSGNFHGAGMALSRADGLNAYLTNTFWGLVAITLLYRIVKAAFWKPQEEYKT